MRNDRCALCDALRGDEDLGGKPRLENTPLLESDRFVVTSCIGPLVAGHVMVVSREHYPSLAAMGSDAIEEYEELISRVRALQLYRDGELLEAEHGATDADCGAACVAHTHIHLLPGFGQYGTMFDGVLDVIYSGKNLAFPDTSRPYIFLRGADQLTRIYDSTGMPPQLVRQTICSDTGREDWDWQACPRYDWIRQTVQEWKKACESAT